LELPKGYAVVFESLNGRIAKERIKAVLSANKAMVLMYWDFGMAILQRQKEEGWGAKMIDRLSYDLRQAFPLMHGFSPRNLKYMLKFAEAWPNRSIVKSTVALLPWRSNITLLDRVEDSEIRLWYLQRALKLGLGKDMLAHHIDMRVHLRAGASANDFKAGLPPLESDMTAQAFKDPYIYDFLGTTETRGKAELKLKLVDHVQKFLLDLGRGFALVGRDVIVEVGDTDFTMDLLFYHLKLRCFVVVELKSGAFQPGHASELSMYCNIVNDLYRHPDDKPTIGLLLVKSKNKMVVEYSLAGYGNQIGVTTWETEIQQSLPIDLKSSLPTIEEIEAELSGAPQEF
jgi:predicted nuclease of restriction endonuclease-like (RecB) superfamily